MTTSIGRRIAASIVALVVAHLAHAELPQHTALQLLEINSTDTTNDPEQPPSGYHDPVTARFVEAIELGRRRRRGPSSCFERVGPADG